MNALTGKWMNLLRPALKVQKDLWLIPAPVNRWQSILNGRYIGYLDVLLGEWCNLEKSLLDISMSYRKCSTRCNCTLNKLFSITCRVDATYKLRLIQLIFKCDSMFPIGWGDELFNEHTTIILGSLLHEPDFQSYIDRYFLYDINLPYNTCIHFLSLTVSRQKRYINLKHLFKRQCLLNRFLVTKSQESGLLFHGHFE